MSKGSTRWFLVSLPYTIFSAFQFGSALEFTSECSKKIGIDRAEHARERQVLVFEPTSEEGSTLTCAGNNYVRCEMDDYLSYNIIV